MIIQHHPSIYTSPSVASSGGGDGCGRVAEGCGCYGMGILFTVVAASAVYAIIEEEGHPKLGLAAAIAVVVLAIVVAISEGHTWWG